MASSIDSLDRQFKSINQFVAAKSSQYKGLADVQRELADIDALFNARQLSLQIFSQFPLLADGLNNFFNIHQGLRQYYISKISELPDPVKNTSTNRPPTLSLKANSSIDRSAKIYNLSSTQVIRIGRDLQHQNDPRLLHVSLPTYQKLSSRHAEIQPVDCTTSASKTWQICDLNSTNGTYINGQKIKGCRTLQSGDTITLAYPHASEKAPEFIFEGESIDRASTSTDSTSRVDTDLVLMVVHPTQGLSEPEKRLVEQISKSSIFGFTIVADISGVKPEDSIYVRENLTSIQNWIKTQYPKLGNNVEIIELALSPFYPNAPASPLLPAVEKQFLQFALPFVNLAKNQGTNVLCSRISPKLQQQIQQIDRILDDREQVLKQEIQRTEASLNGNNVDYWRDRYTSSKKQIEEARDDFFRSAKMVSSRNKDEFSTEFVPNNFLQKTEDFVNKLEPVVNKLNGAVGIQLRSHRGREVHAVMLDFFQTELTQWGDREWEYIRRSIDGKGLEGLLRETYNSLNILPEFQLTNTFGSTISNLNFDPHFATSFNEAKLDISYGESSGDMFGGIAKIAMMSAQVAVSIGASVAQPPSPYTLMALMQGANTVSSLAGFIGTSLNRPQQQQLKLEQVVDSLKRTTANYYKNIARYLLNRVAQEISMAIDAEDRRFRKTRDATDEQMRKYFIELDSIAKSYKIRQEAFYKDRLAFDQIRCLSG
jgi:pSer/pThr/pTyr-binding forkhead associated (FHA) protein